jgi:hypothetical protein
MRVDNLLIEALGGEVDTGFDLDWTYPTLSGTYGTSAGAQAAGEKRVSYRRNGGQLYIRGYLDQGFNAGVPIFQLPANCRPPVTTPLTVQSGVVGAVIEARANGDVVWTGGGDTFLRMPEQFFWTG